MLLFALGFGATHCAPGARGAECKNDSECPDAERGHAYCFQAHCVECMTNASCGAHYRCSQGACIES